MDTLNLDPLTIDQLSPEERRVVHTLLAEKQRRNAQRKIHHMYPETGPLSRHNYPKQMTFFRAGKQYRERAIIAANRIGKTEGCTLVEATYHMTGDYPKWWEGRRYNRPVRCWFVGTTAETTRDIVQEKLLGTLDNLGTGLIPGDKLVGEPRRDSGIPDSVETFQVRHKSGGISRGQFKSYNQGRKSFEGKEQDVIVLDEEPPMDVYGECLKRTMTTDGMIIAGFTPLDGLTEVVLSFLPGGAIPEGGEVSESKFVVGATWDDAPHLTEKAKREILDSTPIHLRNAVSKGIPQIGSGAIYPIDEDDLLVKPFPIPEYWPQAYGFDVGWKATAAVWGAWDRDHDIWYLHSSYKRGQAEPPVHTSAIQARGIWIPGVIDPASRGRSQHDGKQLLQEYCNLGLELSMADNAVEAGIFEVYKRMTTGRIKVFNTLTDWLGEFRVYRRDKNGKVVKMEDHLMDCTRYLIMSGGYVAKVEAATVFRNMSVSEILDRVRA